LWKDINEHIFSDKYPVCVPLLGVIVVLESVVMYNSRMVLLFQLFQNIDKFLVAICLLQVARGIIYVIDLLLNIIFSFTIINGTKAEREDAKRYEKSAQVT
jgi:hypothetical protein